MKLKIIIATVISALTLSACADLGLGVDINSSGVSPYIYGNGPIYNGPWGGLGWSYDFPLRPTPPRPPLIGGPAIVNPPQQPQVRPPMTPPANGNGSIGNNNNGVPTVGINGNQRPGNGGLPSAAVQTQTVNLQDVGQYINNNAKRGR